METFSALLVLCAGNSPVPVNSPHKGQWRGALMFPLNCVWINDWINNREVGDLTRHRGHYDVSVMNNITNIMLLTTWRRKHYISRSQQQKGFGNETSLVDILYIVEPQTSILMILVFSITSHLSCWGQTDICAIFIISSRPNMYSLYL